MARLPPSVLYSGNLLRLLITVLTFSCGCRSWGNFWEVSPTITAFSINGVAGVFSGNSINVRLKWTSTTNLVATFTTTGTNVNIGGVTQVSGSTSNDFTTAKTYTVVGIDGRTANYIVAVIVLYPISDTGFTLCSSTGTGDGALAACPQTITGQDGDFINVPAARSFSGPSQHPTFTNDYTTIDNVTGLVWKSCSEGFTGIPPACTPGAAGTYSLSPDTTTCGTLNAANAGAGYAGRTTWRVPTIEELKSIINYSAVNPSIDTINFPATASNYWSSSTKAPTPANAWIVYFSSGQVNNVAKTNAHSVRCVATGP